MSYSQKYCLIYFINPATSNAQFSMTDWPLHITIADVFAINLTEDTFSNISQRIEKLKPTIIMPTDDAVLGDTKVTLIKKSKELQLLHENVLDILEENGAIFNTPEYIREGFLPHSTIQGQSHIQPNTICIDRLSLIDMFPNGDWRQRKVIDTFEFIDATPNKLKNIN